MLRHIHPGKRRKSARAGHGVVVVRPPAHPAVDAVGVGPVGLDRDGGEALLVDQASGDPRTLAVELVSAVRGLADEDEASVPDAVHQAVVVPGLARDGRHADHVSTVRLGHAAEPRANVSRGFPPPQRRCHDGCAGPRPRGCPRRRWASCSRTAPTPDVSSPPDWPATHVPSPSSSRCPAAACRSLSRWRRPSAPTSTSWWCASSASRATPSSRWAPWARTASSSSTTPIRRQVHVTSEQVEAIAAQQRREIERRVDDVPRRPQPARHRRAQRHRRRRRTGHRLDGRRGRRRRAAPRRRARDPRGPGRAPCRRSQWLEHDGRRRRLPPDPRAVLRRGPALRRLRPGQRRRGRPHPPRPPAPRPRQRTRRPRGDRRGGPRHLRRHAACPDT